MFNSLCACSTNELAAGRRTSGTAAILALKRVASFTWAHFQLQSLQPCQFPFTTEPIMMKYRLKF